MPQKVGEVLAYSDVKITPEFKTEFKLETTDNSISLIILHMKKEHGGLYYCEKFNWDKVVVKVSSGTFLAVTGKFISM